MRTPRKWMPQSFLKILAGITVLLVSGCGQVKASQRQRLADPIMTFDRDPVQVEILGHVTAPREGAIGGFGTIGAGGCGCN